MSIRPYRDIMRRKSRRIMVGSVPVGGDSPITVQTMTNTLTADAERRSRRSAGREEAGVDIVRVSCPDEASTRRCRPSCKAIKVPIVADIHFHYKRAIEAAEAGAACLRINPGNIGSAERVREVVKAAKDHGCSMRIGVNAGSLEKDLLEKYGEPCPEAMVESALDHARILQDHDFHEFKISVKASDVFLAVAAYQQLADACDYPLHIGITEAGALRTGTVKSSIGLGSLLWAGIGDTVRVSLSAEPEEEVRVGFELLKALNLRHRGVNLISCPSCARQQYDVIRTIEALEKRIAHVTTPMTRVGDRLRGERAGRGARDRYRLHRRRQRHAPGLHRGRAAPSPEGRRHRRPSRRADREEGGGDRSREGGGGGRGRATPGRRGVAVRLLPSAINSRRLPVSKLQPVRGTHDLLPDEYRRFAHVIDAARDVARLYGYREMATPIFEFTELFARGIGETTDVVSKEMYTFQDRGGEVAHPAAGIHRRHLPRLRVQRRARRSSCR